MASQDRIVGSGVYDGVQMQVEPTHRALRASLRPQEKGVFGSYSIVLATAAFAAGALAAAPLLAFRWSSASANCLVRRVKAAVTVTTAFAQGAITLDMIRGTGATTQYTGGTAITIAGKSQSRSTRLAGTQQQISASATGNIAIANATALSAPAPTWNFDSNAMGRTDGTLITGLPTSIIWEQNVYDEPLELQGSEAFLIRATTPATGVPIFSFIIDYDEIDPVRYFGMFG